MTGEKLTPRPPLSKGTRAQAVMELAVFGAIFIFKFQKKPMLFLTAIFLGHFKIVIRRKIIKNKTKKRPNQVVTWSYKILFLFLTNYHKSVMTTPYAIGRP